MTTTLNSAFQSLLSSVSDLNLNDGDFLKMNNLLKKAFDSDKETLTEPFDMKLALMDGLGSAVKIDIFEVVREPIKEHPHIKPVKFINYRVTQNSTTKTFSVKPTNFGCKVRQWIIRKRPHIISLDHDGFTTHFEFPSMFENKKEEHKAKYHSDDDECDCDGEDDYASIMIRELPNEIEALLNSAVYALD
jgi:hypothetical protein